MKQCPNCKTAMEEGLLAGAPFWGKGTGVLFHRGSCKVIAHKCPNCGYIMLYEEGK